MLCSSLELYRFLRPDRRGFRGNSDLHLGRCWVCLLMLRKVSNALQDGRPDDSLLTLYPAIDCMCICIDFANCGILPVDEP